jgi:hypothetical protein
MRGGTRFDTDHARCKLGKLYVFGKKIGRTLFAEQHAHKVEVATRNWQELRKKP